MHPSFTAAIAATAGRRACVALFAVIGLTLLGAARPGSAQSDPATRPVATPPEYGRVKFSRDLDATRKDASRPILVLFQEVPGCSTCVQFADAALSHPLLVEAAESLFHPVCVHNNAQGRDKTVLDRYREPAWNNPVVRFVDAKGEDLVPRFTHEGGTAGYAARMVEALQAAEATVPAWLSLFVEEARARTQGVKTAEFEVSCFWEGEAEFAALDGVVATEAGFVDKAEVVRVTFDPKRVDLERLYGFAFGKTCASRAFTRSKDETKAAALQGAGKSKETSGVFVRDREPKSRLLKSHWRAVPMTELQALRVNASLAKGADPTPFLSPRQVELGRRIASSPKAAWPNAVHAADLKAAWDAAAAVGVAAPK